MVQFGKTLNDVVKSDWRCHAVAYIELKRALSDSHPSPNNICGEPSSKCGINGVNGCVDPAVPNGNNDDEDVHSVHTESSYCVSDNQKANFFRIYDDSVRRLTSFYDDRISWATEEREVLEKAVKKTTEGLQQQQQKGGQGGDSNSDQSSSTSFLIHRITNFSRDLGLVLEFLELNATAFSKIMKKFDKRTGSDLREMKLKELRAHHAYLYDGGELKKCKLLCTEWVKQLQSILQQNSKKDLGQLEAHSSQSSRASSSCKHRRGESLTLTRQNSLITLDGESIAKLVEQPDDNERGENPQESCDITHKPTTQSNDVKTTKASGQVSVPRSIYQTKEAQALEKMIDRVNTALCLQKADSPFFDKTLGQSDPPSFLSSEVELAEVLGQGEFCKIYEVRKFSVPESCHICFLHNGYQDPDRTLKEDVVKATKGHNKIPSSVELPDLSQEGPMHNKNGELSTEAIESMNSNSKQATFSFDYDVNVSEYDELEADHEEDHYGYEYSTRGFMKDHCLREGEARYAIKRIRSSIVGEEEITDAAIDLAREAEFLAGLSHPNIIRIRGTISTPGHPKYSIILDRLYDTLEVQMEKWKFDLKRYQGKFKGLIGKKTMMIHKMWTDRLVAAYDLSRAMAYLHSRGVIHRDIKPANIGFDIRGDIKIFDFGLAKELKPCDKEGKDQYHTSGLAGTRRYMAPEMAKVMPYGLSADVYSFGILIWEMLTLKPAFEKYSREKHYKSVVVEGKRPKIPRSWAFVIKNLVERCWHQSPQERPTFQAVCELIKFGLPAQHTVDFSGRSDDLLCRSYRSTYGPHDHSGHSSPNYPPNYDEGVVTGHAMESNHTSDSLSQSIRIKCSPSQLQRKHTDCKPVSSGVVVEN